MVTLRVIGSCGSDSTLSASEALIFSRLDVVSGDFHPDCVAVKLKLSLLMSRATFIPSNPQHGNKTFCLDYLLLLFTDENGFPIPIKLQCPWDISPGRATLMRSNHSFYLFTSS